jgi:hypothetical protein
MKSYPKIDYFNKGLFDSDCIGFDKLDGSNLRFEWSKKRGFYKFGTRNVMITDKDENFGKAIPLFLEKYGEDLPRAFANKYKKVENFVVFAEYVGPNSFAGWHDPNDKMDIVLFDVNQYKKGFISPYEFLDNFGHLHIPSVIYQGKYTQKLIQDVRNNIYELDEGIIVKGITYTKKEGEAIWQVKVKTNEWLKKVKEKLGEKALADELNNDKALIAEYIKI